MKSGIISMMFITLAILLMMGAASSQSVGDYRTKDTGDWGNAQIWQRYNGSTWLNVATPPTGSETITVLAEHAVSINVLVTITGKLINKGAIEDNGNLTIANGGTYQHDRDGGKIPLAVWQPGSIMLITGVTSTAPEQRNQNYHHIIFNTPNLSSNLNMALKNVTIGGDIKVLNTASSRWYLTTAAANDTSIVTIMGDVIVEAGNFSVQGTSNANTTFIVHHYGNIRVTGGNFSIARGSQPGGTTTWYLYQGDFSMMNATTQSSTNPPGNAKFVFCKNGEQNFYLGAGNTLTALPIEVSSGTTLSMGFSKLSGNGVFIVRSGATILTQLAGGVEEILAGVLGAITLEEDSGYGFNGIAAQVTSPRMPTTVGNLLINNPAGVVLSQPTTILGVLRLMAGEFDNTIPFTLGPNGRISYEGGTLKVPTAVTLRNSTIPESFSMEQNYPNPFNLTTKIRFGLPVAAPVRMTIHNLSGQEVASFWYGIMDAGVHELTIDVGHIGAGIYWYRLQGGEWVAVRQMAMVK